ncbi:MAG: Nif3-like dinuclear metal center hexameric protein [Oscillospiraceae bacterium]
MTTVKDIYDKINSTAPFCCQESYDNSGLAVGSMNREVSKILLALDITREVAEEAAEKQSDLVISHHPVIFHGLKSLSPENPAVILAKNNISAIAMHTSFDFAKGGMNDILCKKLGLIPSEPVAVENGLNMGYICECDEISPKKMAEKIKNALGNKVVRYNDCGKMLRKIGVCSGSGGSLLNDCLAKELDALITGDVKHDVFIDAHNRGLCVFDAGHFYTENIFYEHITAQLREVSDSLEISVADANRDILSYEM